MPDNTPVSLSHRGRLGFLLKDSLLYGGAGAVSKAFALITFPLLARHFSVTDYGVLDYFLVLSTFLAIAFTFGQDSGVARYFYEHEDTAERRQLISQSLLFQLAGLALLLPLLWWSAGWVTGFLIEAPKSERLFRIVLLKLPFLLLISFSRNLLKWTFARARFLTMSLGATLVHVSLLLVAVLLVDVGIEGVLLVSLFTDVVFGLLGLLFVRQWLTHPRDFHRLCEMLPFAIPYGVICVLGAFSPALQRSLTDHLLGSESLGLYAMGTKIAMLIGLVVTAFQTAWGPFSLSLHKQADAPHTYNRVLKLFALGMCMVVFGLSLVARPIIHVLASDRYAGAGVVVFPLAMGLAIQATSWITEIGIGIAKRSYLKLYAYTLNVAATLAGIFLLASVFGLFGVALGVVIGHTVKAVILSWLAQRAYPLPWPYAPVAGVLGLTLAFGIVAAWLGEHWGPNANTAVLVVGLLTVLVVGWSVLLSESERRGAAALIKMRVARFTGNLRESHPPTNR